MKVIQASLNNLNLFLMTFNKKKSDKYMYQYCKLSRVIKIHDSSKKKKETYRFGEDRVDGTNSLTPLKGWGDATSHVLGEGVNYINISIQTHLSVLLYLPCG